VQNDEKSSPEVKHLLFRFGMSGSFKLTAVSDIPKHGHLRFFTKNGQKGKE
jgi:endonuclease VIII-like 1